MSDEEEKVWEPSFGRVRNSWNRDWSECEDYRSLNTNMHTVEAYLAAFDASGQRRWLDRAREMTRFVADLGARFAWRLPEHFDASWRVQADIFIENPRPVTSARASVRLSRETSSIWASRSCSAGARREIGRASCRERV